MVFIKDTTWGDVFANWRDREASNPGWVNCATNIKGWPDWEAWRGFTASQIKADQRKWQIYKFTEPFNEIPEMLIGPYSGWQERLSEKNKHTFDDLLNIPEQNEFFKQHDGVQKIFNGLPFTTEFIGLVRDDLDKIVCIEGHHRALAITLAKKDSVNLDFSDVEIKIALAHLVKDEISLLDEVLKRGTAKETK